MSAAAPFRELLENHAVEACQPRLQVRVTPRREGENMKVTALERSQVEQTIEEMIGWALTKDLEMLLSNVAQDEQLFIFHPDSASTVVGFDAFREMAKRSWMNDAFQATDYAIRDMRITFAELGNVAWYSCCLDDHGEWNGKPTGWENCRWTGTLERRSGKWVVVQMHFSFARD
jgi:hypothetical protein